MAFEYYMQVVGTKQGAMKGESPRKEHTKKVPCIDFNYQVDSPKDIATGQASGKRQHKPVTITKEWGPSTPQLFQALCTNEVLKSVLFEFYKTDANGIEVNYYNIKLTNATVSRIEQSTGFPDAAHGSSAASAKHNAHYDTHELERVSFTFQKIEVEHKLAKVLIVDDWQA